VSGFDVLRIIDRSNGCRRDARVSVAVLLGRKVRVAVRMRVDVAVGTSVAVVRGVLVGGA